jgi:hypothetical protein
LEEAGRILANPNSKEKQLIDIILQDPNLQGISKKELQEIIAEELISNRVKWERKPGLEFYDGKKIVEAERKHAEDFAKMQNDRFWNVVKGGAIAVETMWVLAQPEAAALVFAPLHASTGNYKRAAICLGEAAFSKGTQIIVAKVVGAISATIVGKRANQMLGSFVQDLQTAGQAPAAALVAYDIRTGQMIAITSGQVPTVVNPQLRTLANDLGGLGVKTACGNVLGKCAEFRGANELMLRGSRLEDIRFTNAIRPRDNTIVSRCENCQQMFGKK